MSELESVQPSELEQRIIDRTAELEATNKKLAHEIAERKRTEAQLRFQAQLLDSVRESVVATDLEGRVTHWSKGAESLYGYRAEEVMGRSIASFIVESDEKQEEEQRMRTVRETGSWSGRYWQHRKDGSTFWADTFISLVTDEHGRPSGFIGIDRDVTEHKRAEEALQESEARLTLAQEAADIGTGDWDIKSDKVYWSNHQFHLHGMAPTKDNMISLDAWLALVHPDDRIRSVGVIKASIRSGDGFSAEYRAVWPDGQVRWLCGTARVIRDDTGYAVRMIGVSIDITERKRAEEALRESENRLSLALDATTEGIYDWNIQTGEVLFSPRWIESLGYSADEVVPHVSFWENLIHPADVPKVRKLLRDHLEGRTPLFLCENRLRTKSGAYRWSFDRGKVVEWNHQGQPARMVGADTDITERKLVENALRESHQRLRNLTTQLQAVREDERTIIAREVHDELGQALTALKMDLAWTRKSLPKRWKAVPDRISSMISLIDSTLATVRQLSSRLRPAILDDLGLEAAIEWQVHEFVSRGSYEHRLDLKATSLRPDRKRDIAVFRILQEALTNIGRHASASRIVVKLWTKDEALLLLVKDDGKGISDDVLASAYSLGLTGMYERARTLGGSLKIERGVKDRGTVLTLSVPLTSTQSLA